MKRVLVIGGCGFVGSHAVERLLDKGAEVSVCDNLSTSLLKEDGAPEFLPERVDQFVDGLDRAPLDVDAVLHLGCRYPVERERAVWFSAYEGFVAEFMKWLGRAFVIKRLRRIVVGSTLAVYNAPESQGGFGSIAASLRQALHYWHRPPILDVVYAHLPEVHGPRRSGGLPDQVPFAQTAPVCAVADLIADQCMSDKHRKVVDLVVGGELYMPLSHTKALPVEMDIILKEM